MKKFSRLFALMVLLGGMFFTSCNKDDVLETKDVQSENRWCNQEDFIKMYAGQNIDVGWIRIEQDNDFLTLTYDFDGGWKMSEYHLYAGPESEIPMNKKGSPKIGHFPYSGTFSSGEAWYIIQIPIEEIGGLDLPITISAHAVVKKANKEETAWMEGDVEFVNAWGSFLNYYIEDCNTGGNALCTGFRTLTQEEWGTSPISYGGDILINNFDGLRPLLGDVGLGCPSDSVFFLNGQAIFDYLPDTSALQILDGSYTNPTGYSKLLGEILTLRLNLSADANILGFSTAESSLGSQIYIGPELTYNGRSLVQVLYFAEYTLGGCFSFDLTELHSALVKINGNFSSTATGADPVTGLGGDNGFLDCPFD